MGGLWSFGIPLPAGCAVDFQYLDSGSKSPDRFAGMFHSMAMIPSHR